MYNIVGCGYDCVNDYVSVRQWQSISGYASGRWVMTAYKRLVLDTNKKESNKVSYILGQYQDASHLCKSK